MLQAQALVMPSLYESLSLVLLESFSCRVPVIANGNSKVLENHITESGGGWAYKNYLQFNCALKELFDDTSVKINRGNAGYNYVRKNYSWEKIIFYFDEAIEDIDREKESLKNL